MLVLARRLWKPLAVLATIAVLAVAHLLTANAILTHLYARDARLTLTVEAQFLVRDGHHVRDTGVEQAFGRVRAARVTGIGAHLIDARTAFGYLVLRCDRGTATLRADLYGPVGDTRLTRIEAVEVRHDGRAARTFTLEYGDG